MPFAILRAVCVQRDFCPGWVLIVPAADACAVLRKDILDCPAPLAAEILNAGLFCPLQVQCLPCWFASQFLHDPYDSISRASSLSFIFCSSLCIVTTKRPWHCFYEIHLKYGILNLTTQQNSALVVFAIFLQKESVVQLEA